MVACPVCDAETVQCGVELQHCPDCDHIFQYPPAIRVNYDKKYIQDRYDAYPTTEAMSYLRLGFVKAVAQQGRLLDVGYGNGAFVKAALRSGFDAYGNDVHGCDYGIREADLNHGDFWDVVTFFDSLEHFPDLGIIKDLSRRSRTVIVSMPARPENFPADLSWKHFRPGEHLHYFSDRSLSRLFSDKKALFVTDLEDAIRGRPGGRLNIFTMVFGKA